jgi:hypothetical protein
MSNSLRLVPIAAMLLGGCVITDNGDDSAGETGASTNNTTNSSATNSSATNSSASATNVSASASASATGTDDSSGGSTAPAETGADSSSGDASTGGGGACGWGVTGEKMVPMGYVCGGEGEDPSGLMPMGCPEGIELVVGGDCGGNMGITGVGCCDANGDAWFCADDGGGPALLTDDC